MQTVLAALQVVKTVFPKAIAIFGVCCAVIEFVVRDQELDRIRNAFIRFWIRIDSLPKASLVAFAGSRLGNVTLGSLAVCIVIISNVTILLALKEVGLSTDLLELSLYLFFIIIFAVSGVVLWVLRSDVQRFLAYCYSGTFSDAFWRLSIIPCILQIWIWMKPPSGAIAILLFFYGIAISYIVGHWIAAVVVGVVFLIARSILFIANRLTLRIAEAKRGPVLALALVFAIGGVFLDLLIGGTETKLPK